MASGFKITKSDFRGLQSLIQSTPQAVNRAGRIVCTEMVGDIKQSMIDSPRSGEEYKRGKKVHVASSPGSPPRPDTGALINSIRWEEISDLLFHIMDGVEYGLWLEDGTERMEARPFMQPVFIDYENGKFIQIMKQELGF